MSLYNEYLDIIKKVDNINQNENLKLPENSYFLSKNEIACFDRRNGESRYPYSKDGFTLWAYSSGYMNIGESSFYVIPPANEGKEPLLGFFAGLKTNHEYQPISLLGSAKQPNENNERICVYTPQAVYYITRLKNIDFVVRAYVNEQKETTFSLIAVNKSKENIQMYLSMYMNLLLMYNPHESIETKWFKDATVREDGFNCHSVVDIDRTTHIHNYAFVQRISDDKYDAIHSTTSRTDFTGSKGNQLNCSTSLFSGEFEESKASTNFSDMAVCGDNIHYDLKPNETIRLDYKIVLTKDEKALETIKPYTLNEIDKEFKKQRLYDQEKFDDSSMLKLNFESSTNKDLDAQKFEYFIHNVVRQVEYCALAKTSGVTLLGVRDALQHIEAALIWNPVACRAKIIEILGFTNIDGRLPRQYSLPPNETAVPQMDLRAFIDQGVWMIDVLYQYLSYTNDYSILEETCGYYEFLSGNEVRRTNKKNTVLEHVLLIMDFLISKIDHKYTNCLRTLYGDWNDALDGLGVTDDENEEFGSGISVMATTQLYKNLNEMSAILKTLDKYDDVIDQYEHVKTLITKGFFEHAIETQGNQRKIIHGIGDKMSYTVGGFNDVDDQARDGLICNAYYVISELYKLDPSLKNDILEAYGRLDSKYGYKTFEPYFARGTKGVGRIVNLPKGTAENSATYVHATLFSIWSLFLMGESEKAFEQIMKIIPITHEKLSTTTFVMPNSYLLNEAFNMDGESMNDWYTGSSCVLIKVLVRCLFGIDVKLDRVIISPSKFIPFKQVKMQINVRNKLIDLEVSNDKQRSFYVNGEKIASKTDMYTSNEYIEIKHEDLKDVNKIIVK